LDRQITLLLAIYTVFPSGINVGVDSSFGEETLSCIKTVDLAPSAMVRRTWLKPLLTTKALKIIINVVLIA
jgi:hypothetical protein